MDAVPKVHKEKTPKTQEINPTHTQINFFRPQNMRFLHEDNITIETVFHSSYACLDMLVLPKVWVFTFLFFPPSDPA